MTKRRRKPAAPRKDYWGQTEPRKDVKSLLSEIQKVADELGRLLSEVRAIVG